MTGQLIRQQEAAVLDGLAEIEQEVRFPQVERSLLMQVTAVEDFRFPVMTRSGGQPHTPSYKPHPEARRGQDRCRVEIRFIPSAVPAFSLWRAARVLQGGSFARLAQSPTERGRTFRADADFFLDKRPGRRKIVSRKQTAPSA